MMQMKFTAEDIRRRLSGTSLIALAMTIAGPATAQSLPEPQSESSAAPEQLEQLVVTGSRIVKDGSTSPTPVTVVGADYLQQRGQTNIADALNELPSFRASSSPQQSASFLSGAGANFADLRSLGSNRTLTLIDGKRFVPSATTGQVDLNLIPTILVERVEVVTGGASASYGSDAVAGVVNLLLKDDFEGLETDFQHGRSEHDDDVEYRAAIHAGGNALDGRLHFSMAGEYVSNDGAGDFYSRDWGRREYGIVTNPAPGTNGQPLYTIADRVHTSTMAPGGLITSGPLRGTTFLPDGTPTQFNYGRLVGTQQMIGGDGTSFFQGFALLPQIKRKLIYGRTNFDVTDRLNVFLDVSWSRSDAVSQSAIPFNYGNLTIRSDNAFLPASIRDAMARNAITSFGFGRFNTDLGSGHNYNDNEVKRGVLGVEGDIGAEWTYDVSFAYGRYTLDYHFPNSLQPARFTAAIDAVADPATGRIVCRSTLTSPNNGCVPFNPFGSGRNDASRLGYILGEQWAQRAIDQKVAAANLQGPLFALPGGDLKAATGVEYRRESASATVDAASLANAWLYGNSKPVVGSYNVKEVYGEVDAPLVAGLPLVERLNLTGAVRYTDYSTTGSVETWKGGVDWALNDRVRLRATRSRDIRAPNITELFNPSASLPLAINDPVTGTQYFTSVLTAGNPNLKPERADNFTAGVVLEPLPQVTFTADYFETDVKGAIASLAGQDIINRCYRGETLLCSGITREGSGSITAVNNSVINIASLKERGLELEASYYLPLSAFSSLPGALSFRALATKTFQYDSNDGVVTLHLVGQTSSISRIYPMVPDWVANANIGYDVSGFSGLLTARFISAGKFDNRYVEGIDINNNHTPSRLYFNVSGGWKTQLPQGTDLEIYAVVNNLLDKDPPIVPDASRGVTNYTYYDVIGRTYTAGLRLKF